MEYRQQLDVFIVGKGQICLGINVRRQFLKPPENAQIPSHKVKSVLDGRDKLVKSTIQKQRREIERSQTGFPTYSVRISNLPHNQMPRYCDRKQKCENSLLSGCDKRSVLCPNVDHFARKSRRKEILSSVCTRLHKPLSQCQFTSKSYLTSVNTPITSVNTPV